jgi:uncharacterized repeat protein (TIGR02543 family)
MTVALIATLLPITPAYALETTTYKVMISNVAYQNSDGTNLSSSDSSSFSSLKNSNASLNVSYRNEAENTAITLSKPTDELEQLDDNGAKVATWTCAGYRITAQGSLQTFNSDGNATYTVATSDVRGSGNNAVIMVNYLWVRTPVPQKTITYNFNTSALDGATIYPVMEKNQDATGPAVTTFYSQIRNGQQDIRYAEDASKDTREPGTTIKEFSFTNGFTESYTEGSQFTVGSGLMQRTLPADDNGPTFSGYPIDDFIARKDNGNGTYTYYQLTGWKVGETETVLKQGAMATASTDMTLTAQWKPLTLTESDSVLDPLLLVKNNETDTDVTVSQKVTGSADWSTEQVTIGTDGLINYQVSMTPNTNIYTSEAYTRYFKTVNNPEFAAVNVTVTLGSGLEPVADDEGFTTIKLSTSALGVASDAKVKADGVAVDTVVTTETAGYTVKAKLGNATIIIIPLQWYRSTHLGYVTKLEIPAKAKTGATTGFTLSASVEGSIDLSKAHTGDALSETKADLSADQLIRYVLADDTWSAKYTGVDIVDTLQAAKDLEIALSSFTYTSNIVTAQPTTYSVTYDSAGGSSVSTETVLHDQQAKEPAPPTRTGYTFAGWYNGETAYNFSTPVTGNVELTAKWEDVYNTVTFNSAGGSSVNIQSVKYGATAQEPPTPTRSGYSFMGWYNGTTQYDFSTPVTEALTLTAQWYELPTVPVSTGNNGSTTTKPSTDTVTNEDGSTTVTETSKDGTVTVTDTAVDGSTKVTETAKDGSSKVTETAVDGSTKVTETAKDGATKVTETAVDGSTTVTETATDGATKVTETATDGAVKITEKTTDGTVTIDDTSAEGIQVVTVAAPQEDVKATVTLPEEVTEATVVIPTEEITAGLVAVDAETGEVLKLSAPTEDGLALLVDGNVSVVLVDNSKDFEDVAEEHWGSDAIDFASSRELFQGTTETTFEPEEDMTRAMILTVLARLDGQDTTTGETWYENAVEWAKENEISDGTDLEGSVTREQLATMLYRYAGEPEPTQETLSFDDADQVSDWAQKALLWANENGIINGKGDGILDPTGTATRAEVAQLLKNYISFLTR